MNERTNSRRAAVAMVTCCMMWSQIQSPSAKTTPPCFGHGNVATSTNRMEQVCVHHGALQASRVTSARLAKNELLQRGQGIRIDARFLMR